MTGPVLETERLILRPIAMEDFPRWAEMMGDSEAGAWSLTGVSMFSIIGCETGLWLGRAGPWSPPGWPGTEVGWALHPDARGKGYGVEAATATIDHAFDVLGWTEVIHTIAPDNTPSQRLAGRIGSRNQGPTRLPPPFNELPVDSWGQSREAWRARAR